VAKLVKAMALMEQPYIKDPEKTVATVVKEATATIGEKISVRRFSRCAPARAQALPARVREGGRVGRQSVPPNALEPRGSVGERQGVVACITCCWCSC